RPSLLALARLRVAGAAAAGWPQRPRGSFNSCLAPRRPGEGPARGPGRASTRVAPGGVSAASPPGGGSRGRSQGTPERRPDCSETAPRRGRGSRFARRGPGARRMRACETAPPGDAWAKGLAAGFLRTSYPAQTSRTRARETTSGGRGPTSVWEWRAAKIGCASSPPPGSGATVGTAGSPPTRGRAPRA
ncbi:unnamed protein product, partial [Prorocentrum cordatum]